MMAKNQGESKMSAINNILELIEKLTTKEKAELQARLMSNSANVTSLEDFITTERYASGRVCPIYGSIHVIRNGHRKDGTQKYMCRDCKKSFVVTTSTIVSGTKKDLSVWEKYISCMMNGFSVRKTAEICGVHRNTAFYWRHKILDALQNMANSVQLNGIVEVDETFFSVSYKGSRNLPREAHKRGGEVHLRGLSHEKVCVPCAVNRNGLSIAKISNLGRVSTQAIHSVYDRRINEESTIVTDKASAYIRFAKVNELNLIQLKNGVAKKGIYNIQHINNYHSRLKKFMNNFNGVSTKYLNNYLIWNNFANYAKETKVEKQNILMRFALTTVKNVTCKQISQREILPVCA